MSDPATPTSTRHDHAAEIEQHAQLEHPNLAWDDQATVFTTGRFTSHVEELGTNAAIVWYTPTSVDEGRAR